MTWAMWRTPAPPRRRAAWGPLVGLVFVLAACGGTSGAVPVRIGAEILVGAAISQSGPLAGEGQLVVQGYQMWVDWIDSHGGVLVAGVRHPVRLLLRDDQSRPDLAGSLATQLVTRDGVQFLLGPYGSDTTLRVSAVAEQASVPLVEAAGAAQAIFNRGFRYTFGVAQLTDQYFVKVLEMASQMRPRPRTMALLWADDSFSSEVADWVRNLAVPAGFTLVMDQRYPAGSTAVTPLVSKAAALRPDVLVNSGHTAEAVAIHRAARALGLDASLFAYSVGPSTPDFVAQLGPDADYVFVGAQWTPQLRYQPQMYLTTPQYIAAYQHRFGTLMEPAYLTADGTAAGLALQRALEVAGSVGPTAVRNALVGLDVTTFAGRLKFDSRGADVYKPMVVEQIQQSRLRTVYPENVADVGPAYPTPPWVLRQ